MASAGKTIQYTLEDHPREVLTQLHRLRDEFKFCDVLLTAGNDGFQVTAHRIVLAAASEYFASMFDPLFRESCSSEVTIHDVGGDSLKVLVDFCYTGRLLLSAESAPGLLAAGRLLQLHGAVNVCCDFLATYLNLSNWSDIAALSARFYCTRLTTAVYDYMDTHFTRLCGTEHLFGLSAQQMAAIVCRADLQLPREECAFQAVVRWMEHDPDERKQYARELLGLVRFPLMKPASLLGAVKEACIAYGVDDLLQEQRSVARRVNTAVNILAVSTMQFHAFLDLYEPSTNVWTHYIMLPNVDSDPIYQPLIYNDQLYFIGSHSIQRFDFETRCLNAITSFDYIVPLSVALLNGIIYINTEKYNEIERFDLENTTWLRSITVSIREPKLIAANGKLYVFSTDGYRTPECYDPVSETWIAIADLNVIRYFPTLCAGNKLIYAHSGRNENDVLTQELECYDILFDRWTTIASLPDRLDDMVLMGTRLFGFDASGERFRCYDLETDSWTVKASIPECKEWMCLLSLPQSIVEKLYGAIEN